MLEGLTGGYLRSEIQDATEQNGDPFAIGIYGKNAATWNPSSEEAGKNQIAQCFLDGMVNAISNSIGTSGDFARVESDLGVFPILKANTVKIGTEWGINDTKTKVTALQAGGVGLVGLQYKTRSETFTNGVLTAVGSESDWIDL